MEWVRFIFQGVCHQMSGRALEAGGFVMPLCARCAGMYVGFALGVPFFLAMARARTAVREPWQYVIAGAAAALWGADGLANCAGLVSTTNAARFALGISLGVSLSLIIARLFMEESERNAPNARGGRIWLAAFVAFAAAVAALNVHPARGLLVVESAAALAGFVIFLVTIHTAVVAAVCRRWRKRTAFAVAGVTAGMQIALLSLMRGLAGV